MPTVGPAVVLAAPHPDGATGGGWAREETADPSGLCLDALLQDGSVPQYRLGTVAPLTAVAAHGRVIGSPLVAVGAPPRGASTDFASDRLVHPVAIAQGALLVAIEPVATLRF